MAAVCLDPGSSHEPRPGRRCCPLVSPSLLIHTAEVIDNIAEVVDPHVSIHGKIRLCGMLFQAVCGRCEHVLYILSVFFRCCCKRLHVKVFVFVCAAVEAYAAE